jgi:polyadenylate-binding protein
MHEAHLHGKPPQGRNILFVADLSDGITEGELSTFFASYKDNIVMYQISKPQKEYQSNRPTNATVIFKDPKQAEEALRDLNMRRLRGKTVRIQFFDKENNHRFQSQNNLFVNRIPKNITPREFYEHFNQFGEITSAKINEDEDGNHNGYGYIHYSNKESVKKALDSCDGKEVWGTKLEIKPFQKKNERLYSILNEQRIIYVKYKDNNKTAFNEKQVRDLFKAYGNIEFLKILVDNQQRNCAIVAFDSEKSAEEAKRSVNGTKLNNGELYIDILIRKSERKRQLINKIANINQRINSQYKQNNLHIRNSVLQVRRNKVY